MKPEELSNEFIFDPTKSRAMGFVSNVAIVRDSLASGVTATAQLLDRETKQPSNKWIWLQMQPADALALAASILVLAKKEQWQIRPDLLELVQEISLSRKDKSN
jgi:hypothetical protein